MKLLADLLNPTGLASRGFCMVWQPALISLHAGSDVLVAVSYCSIPLAIGWFIHQRRDVAHRRLIQLFAASLLACGAVHWLAVLTLWVPAYWLEGVAKATTAILSLTTAVILWPSIPRALALPSPADLQQVNRQLSLRIAESDRGARLLQQSEARYRGIYNRTPVPLHTLDVEGRLNGISDYWCDLLGYSRDDVIGRPLEEFCPLETASHLAQSLSVLLGDGELREAEYVFRKKDGALIDVMLSARLERDSLGRPLHILGVLTDVTGRKQAERALRASEERLLQSQKMEAIGKLTGGIAHDFNNMLTVIDGNLEMLRPRLGNNGPALKLVEAAGRASGRAEKLTAQLLAFSRRQRLDPKPLEPRRVIEGMSSLLSRTVGEQVSLHIELPEETVHEKRWSCLADQNQLEAALLNLVINATHAISQQGQIRIRVANTSLNGIDTVWLDANSEDAVAAGDYVCISVIDDGCGMSEEVRRRALEPFFTTKPVGKGTGLGLSQTYGFVRQSGGAMRIDSRPGRGTVVEMLLPRAVAMHGVLPLSLADGASQAGARPSLETLLVVEDEPELLEIVSSSLSDSGYEVISAPDATHALAALKANPLISLIFTDIVMPGINGVALAEEARRMRPGIPVVYASGYSDETITEQLPKGAVFLQKPYRIATVTKLIQTALATTQLSLA